MSHTVKELCKIVDTLAGESDRVFFSEVDYEAVFVKFGRCYVTPESSLAKLQRGWVGTTLAGSPIGLSPQVRAGTVVVAPTDVAADELEGFVARKIVLLENVSKNLPVSNMGIGLPHPDDMQVARDWVRAGAPMVFRGLFGDTDVDLKKVIRTIRHVMDVLPSLHPVYCHGTDELRQALRERWADKGLRASCRDGQDSVCVVSQSEHGPFGDNRWSGQPCKKDKWQR